MASHIVFNEVGKPVTLVKVDSATKMTAEGDNYLAINPNGYVPALKLDDGSVLTENIALLTYLVEDDSAGELALPADRLARARLMGLLSFLTSELHKAYSPFFAQQKPEGSALANALDKLGQRVGYIDGLLSDGRQYLTGSNFSVADAYAFVILNWSKAIDFSLKPWPLVEDYVKLIMQRPAVRTALATEGLSVEPA